MRKITLVLILVGMLGLQSCVKEEVIMQDINDQDTISMVWEYNSNVNFTPSNNYSLILPFRQQIFASDMILVYRLSGVFQGNDVWKIQPETYYFEDGTLDFGYDFDFTRNDVNIFLHGFDLAGISGQFRINQVFRVVVIPAFFANKMAPSKIDLSDYDAVIKAYNIDDSKVKVLK